MSLLSRRPFVPSGAPPPGYAAGSGRGALPFTTRADLGIAPVVSGAGGGSSGFSSVIPGSAATTQAPPLLPGGRGRGRGSGVVISQGHHYQQGAGTSSGGSSPQGAGGLFGAPPPGYIPGRGRGATGFAGGVSRDDATDDRDRGDYSDTNFDEFSGYSEGLFRDSEYDEEDVEADNIYNEIEQKMDMRRKSRREQRFKAELAKLRAEKPTLSQQFADLKRGLSTVTQEEWECIPEIGDYSLKTNKQKRQKLISLTPAPDSLILNAHAKNQTTTSISAAQTPVSSTATVGIGGGMSTPIGMGVQSTLGDGLRTPLGLATPLLTGGIASTTGSLGGISSVAPSLNDLGEARGTVLSVKLDKVMDSVSGQTVIDPKGYLTDLNSVPVSTDANIADIKKARLLLRSLIQTNPSHAPGWIAAARLEELAGQIPAARLLIAQGCERCATNEDVWLEAARLEKPKEAKAVLASGVKHLPHSVKLWLEAASRESDIQNKRKVLRKALQLTPNSVRLWKEAISLEDPATARILLQRAVECVPQSVELWLALAKLSPYQDAQKVLNEARKKVPTSVEIWISAAKLEESQGNASMVERIIGRGLDNLSAKGVTHDRDVWLKHAEEAEKTDFVHTAEAIVKHTMGLGVEDVNKKRIWVTDAEAALGKGCYKVARALYTNALEVMSHAESIWLALAQLDLQHSAPEVLDQTLRKAVDSCNQSESLWLMAAKQKWLRGDIEAARALLAEAFRHVAAKEAVTLAAVKLEREAEEFERARVLLDQARVRCNNSEAVWMQSVQLERLLGQHARATELVSEALKLHPKSARLWMIAGQIKLQQETPDRDAAMALFEQGRTQCPHSVELWLCAVDIYRSEKNWARARALLEEARLRNPKQELLWLAAVEVEIQANGVSRSDWNVGTLGKASLHIAHHLMTKALQECPRSGILWAEAIFLEAKAAQNAKSVDALTACENDANVILAVGKQFWRNHKIGKARRWIQRAIAINPRLGDAWIVYLHFEIENGDDETRLKVLEDCRKAEPNQGLSWNRVVKHPNHWRLTYPQKLKKALEDLHPDVLSDDINRTRKPIGQKVLDFLNGINPAPLDSDIKFSPSPTPDPSKQSS